MQGWSTMSARISAVARVAVGALVFATSVGAQSEKQIAFVHIAGAQQRLRYLATARIWSDRQPPKHRRRGARAASPGRP